MPPARCCAVSALGADYSLVRAIGCRRALQNWVWIAPTSTLRVSQRLGGEAPAGEKPLDNGRAASVGRESGCGSTLYSTETHSVACHSSSDTTRSVRWLPLRSIRAVSGG